MSNFKVNTIMKKQFLLTVIFAAMAQIMTFAQVPEKAKDVSPLLYGEKIPAGVLKTP